MPSSFQRTCSCAIAVEASNTLAATQTIQQVDNFLPGTVPANQSELNRFLNYQRDVTTPQHQIRWNWIADLPFGRGKFIGRNAGSVLNKFIGGWQIAGIVNISSGQPMPRISVSTNNFRRGGFADLVGDINEGEQELNGRFFWFNPAAFAPPADGSFGNSGRAPFRQPSRHQWDITLSKNFRPTERVRMQFRADFINAFNQRQWLADPLSNGIDNTCTTSVTSCTVANDTFGALLNTRAPREIQLGLRVVF